MLIKTLDSAKILSYLLSTVLAVSCELSGWWKGLFSAEGLKRAGLQVHLPKSVFSDSTAYILLIIMFHSLI